jgi:hypothetical protein
MYLHTEIKERSLKYNGFKGAAQDSCYGTPARVTRAGVPCVRRDQSYVSAGPALLSSFRLVITRSPLHPFTSYGARTTATGAFSWPKLVPLPTWPWSLDPQQYTRPAAVRPQVTRKPVVISTYALPPCCTATGV